MKIIIRHKKNNFFQAALRYAAAIFLSFLILALFGLGAFFWFYQGKIYPGVSIGGVDVSGQTPQQAEKVLQKTSALLNSQGLYFQYKNNEVVVSPVLVSADPDLSQEIFSYNLPYSAQQAYLYGRQGNLAKRFFAIIKGMVEGKDILPSYYLNKRELREILVHNFSGWEDKGENARLKISYLGKGHFLVKVVPERLGWSFDYNLALRQAEKNLASFSAAPIQMYRQTNYPSLKIKDIEKILPQTKKVLLLAPLKLKISCQTFSQAGKKMCAAKKKRIFWVSSYTFAHWLQAKKKGDRAVLALQTAAVKKYLNHLAASLNQKPQDARFKMSQGKVVAFRQGKNGLELAISPSLKNISQSLFQENTSTAVLVLKEEPAKNSIANINDLGIEKIIGQGESDFAGSPPNRVHNILQGVKTLDGLLIKPNEEFSLNKALGPINAQTGYLPELVIKGNKTVPEYGGGLCQIATTMFRAAVNTGLPITERQAHAYQVSYYKPAGTDATIYDPQPDLKFINDTGHYILIQAKIKGTHLTFQFWGTPDGRKVTVTKPKVFNIVPPGPTKFIPTDTLPPGVKKYTERAHNGADAEFTQIVTYPNGKVRKKVFYSHYKPWRAVCLVGEKPTSTAATTTAAQK